MGIQGLLPLLKSIHKPTHLRSFAGQTLGIDAYGWLHRGTVACAVELANGEPTRKHIDFALHRVRMLIHFGVKPYLVFDGDYLPSKAHTEKERAARRKESRRVGLEMLRMGRSSQAQLELQKAVDVTPTMARELIEELKAMDVPYIVAPYEADSQLTYLEKHGHISGVISEDSDLLVFGVQCLLTKLDQFGECIMINRADFTACREISLVGWTDKEFRAMAMLSGCDYLPGIEKMGLKTAYRLVRKHQTVEKVVRTVQFDGKMKIPKDYLDAFQKAERTFLYQWVFCPEARSVLNLKPLPTGLLAETMPYIGKHVEPDHAAGVACGDLDPSTKKPIILPQRLRPSLSRARTTPASSEKPGKPIDEYFKTRRIPLAELDVNSFTPSPTQQRLLEAQTTRTWSASQIPPPRVFGSARAANTQPPSSAPQASRRNVTSPLPIPRRASPKRQRLCSDSGVASALKGTPSLTSSTSRFFLLQATQPSPSLRQRSRRAKQEEFDLWSVDSAAEVVAAATVTSEQTKGSGVAASSPRKRKKLSVFVDAAATEEMLPTAVSQETVATMSTTDSQTSMSVTTPHTSFGSTSSREHIVSSRRTRLHLATLEFQGPSMRRTTSVPFLACTPVHGETSTAGSKSRNFESPQDVDDSGIVLESPPGASNATFPSNRVQHDDDESSIDDQELLDLEKQPSRIFELPLQGSEDQLIPESPGHSSDSSGSRPVPDLSQFAFAG